MKIVYSWLKEIVDITVTADELAEALTRAGLEVASVQHLRVPAGVKVAKILTTERHPNADRLTVCAVDAGGPSPLQIVCGAPNTRPGMLAPLAIEGAVLGPDVTVKRAKLRGVESSGMLCSERELGLSEDHGGIMDLPAQWTVGDELSVYYPEDAVIEIEIVPSRGDCLSMVGVAREIAARYRLPLKSPALRPVEDQEDPVAAALTVTVTNAAACPRYAGRLVRGVTIAPSPEWMQRRLTLAGLRPINNIVDITNYLLIQYGQPMHAFDYRLIGGRNITVAQSPGDLRFTTLDGTERRLVAGDLLIRDAQRPVALAGIMGGAGSEISASTTDVFIECAYFDPITIRKTSKRLGLSTDSSYRFERGVDPAQGLVDAVDSAAALMQQLGNGRVASGRIDVYPQPLTPRAVTIRPARTGKVLGHPFSAARVIDFLASIGIACARESDDDITCIIPLFRHDLVLEEDLIEEVGRLFGYDAIPAAVHAPVALNNQSRDGEFATDRLRHALAFAGFCEIVTNSMSSKKNRELLTPSIIPVTLLNPLNPEMAEMRTTLAGSMLEVLRHNLNHKNHDCKLFELGKTYECEASGEIVEKDLLGIVVEGDWMTRSWHAPAIATDMYYVKGLLETMAHALGGKKAAFSSIAAAPLFDEAMAFTLGDSIQGRTGRLAPPILRYFEVKTRVYYIEADITRYLNTPLPRPIFTPLPKFPAVERDFCFVMKESLSAGEVSSEIYSLSPLVEEVTPFDLYQGEKLSNGLKSIAYSVTLRSLEHTLTEKEVEPLCSTIISVMDKKFNAKLRT
ncbi:MAG: phenylalanine--tRNA ligase subunit beta [Chitinispirillaceae bacterium]|nr:phenylalanine--tRNA ligase subunit beta [Chitinispirillaceae bacterium]